jgi:ribosomal protein S12 methylthiotransferase
LYCYPEGITDELIQEIKTNPKVCKYLDMPIQHASNAVLKRMARKSSLEYLKELLTKLRQEIPEIAIRTTLIVGFPGETQEDFDILCDFVQEIQFDRLGVFTYSQEEDTPAATFEDQIDESVKQKRKEVLMDLQHSISEKLTRKKIGKTMEVVIEGRLTEENVYIGRTYQDAPDIDGQVFIDYDGQLLSGDLVNVHIVDANDYDLIGEIVDEYSE